MTRLYTLGRKRTTLVVVPVDPPSDKLAAAKLFLGSRWLLHTANHIKRLVTPFGGRK